MLRAAPIKPGNLEVHWPEGNTRLSKTAIDPESLEPDSNAVVTVEARPTSSVGGRLQGGESPAKMSAGFRRGGPNGPGRGSDERK